MKRDINLIKDILIELEKSESPIANSDFTINGKSDIEVSYHIKLLYEAGLIEAENISGFSSYHWIPITLTWHGHEFLDAARNDTIWNQVKEKLKEQGGNMPFSVLHNWMLKLSENLLP